MAIDGSVFGHETEMIIPHITIVIPTALESNQKYLSLCLQSINRLNYPKDRIETIVVASRGFKPDLPAFAKPLLFQEHMHFAKAVNSGFRAASPDSDHYVIVSDDVVLTANSIGNMVSYLTNPKSKAVLGPISNCDQQLKYQLLFGINTGKEILTFDKPSYRYEETLQYHEAMLNAFSIYPRGCVHCNDLCFYMVLITKAAWMEIGELDETFKSGQEDLDYCVRAGRLRVPVARCLDSLVWHFGGVTAETVITDDIRKENIAHFESKFDCSWQKEGGGFKKN